MTSNHKDSSTPGPFEDDLAQMTTCDMNLTMDMEGSPVVVLPLRVQVAQPNLNDDATFERTPKPPMWLVVSAREENYNYHKFSRYIQKKVGCIDMGNISRFGKGSVLIHAKLKTQSYMLTMKKFEKDDNMKEIRPHMNFSCGKGMVFDRDLCELTEREILEISPTSVWKVRKVPKANMVILTFEDSDIPSYINLGNERVKVKPFLLKPLQCYNCFQYGHPSRFCKNNKLCNNCSAPEYGPCSKQPKCINCEENHTPFNEKCSQYKYEEAAICTANAEHISISYTRKLISQTKTYAMALNSVAPIKTQVNNVAPLPAVKARTTDTQSSDLGDRPVRVEAPLSKKDVPADIDSSPIDEILPVSVPSLQQETLEEMEQEQTRGPKRERTVTTVMPTVRMLLPLK
ncbi:uncharacterized protein LOC135216560 [Macrobrachium nipponense]|uniref:uncharacterized protein LOC135216560 n=1 Tax=Macrobrachium nipponense TaxID=159736 RepID=UPI0030C85C56